MEEIFYMLGNILNDARYSLPAANTSSNQAIFFVQALHVIDDLYGELAPGAAQRMTQRNRSAVDVHLIRIEPEFADHRK